MDEEKKFEMPEIILLLIVAVLNDFLEIIGDFSLALPFVGEIAMAFIEVGNSFVWGGITLWFIMKLGLGGPALLQIAGGSLEMIGVPSRTITVGWGIFLANHPKLAEVATVATIAEGGIALEESAETTEKAATASREVAVSEELAAGREAVLGAEEAGMGGAVAESEAVSEEAALKRVSPEKLGEEKSPFEKLEELTEKIPSAEKEGLAENEEVEMDDSTNTVDLS